MDYFPNGNLMQYFKFFKLADDADDTAYVYLTEPKKDHKWLKKKIIKHANGTLKWNLFLPETYRNLKAYGVYFGKNMHIEIDVCVLTNILLWNFKQENILNEQDQDSIDYITKSIRSKDYFHKPYLISPCYPTTAQICYHISRLIKETKGELLSASLIPVLTTDIHLLLKTPKKQIDEVLLHISLMNLGIKPVNLLNYDIDVILKDTSYFYTSIPLMIPKLWARKLQKHKPFQFLGLKTKCDGYTIAFLLEYELLYQNINKTK